MCEVGRPPEEASMASRRRPQPGLSGGLLVPDPEQEASLGCGGGTEATRRRPRGWRAVAFIIGVYAAAYLAGNAFSFSLTSYLIDRYNMKQNAATDMNNVFSGTFNFAPVVGAFVADAFWGRFRTLLFGTVVGLAGMAVITVSATVHRLKPPPCSPTAQQTGGTCAGPSALQRAVLYLGMALLVVSAGSMNPTSLPFGADQFDDERTKAEQQHKQQGGGLALARFYNWYYAVAMAATFLALTVVLYVQVQVSWALGFAIPTALMAAALAAFLAGAPVYVHVPPEGSIFSSVARVLVASCRKCRLPLPHPGDARRQEELLYNPPAAVENKNVFRQLPLTLQLSFLNKAAIVTDADAGGEIRADNGSPARALWSLCSVQQVEEAKCLVKVIPVWISGTVWFTVVTELLNYTFLQAMTMDLHVAGNSFTVPAASVVAIFYVSVALSVPVYDLLTATRRVTLLQRQGAGLVMGAAAFVVAAAVERRRRRSTLAPLSVFLLAPQLGVMGVSGSLNMVGQTEFYNTQFPDQMRTLANAAFYCAQGVSGYLATLVVSVVNAWTTRGGQHGGSAPAGGWVTDDINQGRIDYFYYAMAALSGANFVYFLVCAHFYQYKGDLQAADDTSPGDRAQPETDSGSVSEGSDAALLKT